MRKLGIVVAVACLLGVMAPAHAKRKPPPKLKLAMSNFRYCRTAPCSPLDAGYLRTGEGPLEGFDNPEAVINVKKGTIVTWVYRDNDPTFSCDSLSCGGHNVYVENGTPGGKRIGFAPSNTGPKTIKYTIKQRKGTTIRYFCTVNSHWQTGMTGILRVT